MAAQSVLSCTAEGRRPGSRPSAAVTGGISFDGTPSRSGRPETIR